MHKYSRRGAGALALVLAAASVASCATKTPTPDGAAFSAAEVASAYPGAAANAGAAFGQATAYPGLATGASGVLAGAPDCSLLGGPSGYPAPDGTVRGFVASGLDGACHWSAVSQPLVGVSLELVTAGPDGAMGTADDAVLTTLSGQDGCFIFKPIPLPFSGELRSPATHTGKTVTCDSDGATAGEVDIVLAGNAPGSLQNVFGYVP